jgi:hypothetical protein
MVDMTAEKKRLVNENEGESWAYYHQIKFLIDHYDVDVAGTDPVRTRFMAAMARNLQFYFVNLSKEQRGALWSAWEPRVKTYLQSQGMRPKVSREFR